MRGRSDWYKDEVGGLYGTKYGQSYPQNKRGESDAWLWYVTAW